MRTVLLSALVAVAVLATPAAGAPATTPAVGVYLVRHGCVAPVRRVAADGATLRGALDALLRGPTAVERRAGYGTAVPAGTQLLGVTLLNGVATVDLSPRFGTGGDRASTPMRVAQVVDTVTQFPEARRVAFRIQGRIARTVGAGVVTWPPLRRRDVEAQDPPILVEQPLPGDLVTRRISVAGTADVFEARLVVELRTTGGAVLARRLVSATSGSGVRGSFSVRVAVPVTAELARAVVAAYARSPKDGRPIDVVRVPVRIAPG